MNLMVGGINLDKFAVFCDRGKQMSSWRRLTVFGLKLHLKNCTYHISKNVCAKFGPRDEQLNCYLFELQECASLSQYIRTLVKISQRYGPKIRIGEEEGDATGNESDILSIIKGSIIEYLMGIHPRQFSVVGNAKMEDDEERKMMFIWGLLDYGEAKHLFGIRTTNGVEGVEGSIF